jgi:hypothetical protein
MKDSLHFAGLPRRIPAQCNSADAMISSLFDELRRRERWLLIYDSAEQPHTLHGLLPPGGSGSVLMTSRGRPGGNAPPGYAWTCWTATGRCNCCPGAA